MCCADKREARQGRFGGTTHLNGLDLHLAQLLAVAGPHPIPARSARAEGVALLQRQVGGVDRADVGALTVEGADPPLLHLITHAASSASG